MMQSGQIGGVEAPPAPGRPGQGPAAPAGPGAVVPVRRPAGPRPADQGPQAPARPRPGPAAPSPARPRHDRPAAPVQPPIDDEDEKKKAAGRLGTPADRAGRRAKRNERANERRDLLAPAGLRPHRRRPRKTGEAAGAAARRPEGRPRPARSRQRKSHAEIEPPITVRSLSEAIGVRANDLIRRMMNSMGQMVNINANLDDEAAQMLALEFGVELQVVHERTAEDDLLDEFESRDEGRGDRRARRPAADHHDPRPRRPRQDLAARQDPQGQRRRHRERRHHPAHRRLPGRSTTASRSPSSTPPATRRSPPCGPAGPT